MEHPESQNRLAVPQPGSCCKEMLRYREVGTGTRPELESPKGDLLSLQTGMRRCRGVVLRYAVEDDA